MNSARLTDPEKAAGLLAALVEREMGVKVTSEAMLNFIRNNWRALSFAAHSIAGVHQP